MTRLSSEQTFLHDCDQEKNLISLHPLA